MEIEMEDFSNAKPVILSPSQSHLREEIQKMLKNKQYKEILQLTASMPNNAEKYLIATNALLHLRDWKRLLNYCNQALTIAQESEFYHLKGKATGKLGDPKQQIQLINKAIKINPNVAAYHRNIGAGLYSIKQYHTAIVHHLTAINIEPNNPINYHNKGMAYFRLNQYDQALQQFTRAITINPNQALSFSWKGDCLKALNRYQQAFQCYDRAYTLTHNDTYKKQKEKMEQLLKKESHS